MIRIPGLGGDKDFATAINDSGTVVGQAFTQGNLELHPFFWDRSGLRDLGTFGGPRGYANDVNSNNWVVGSAKYDGDPASHAYVWKGEGDLLPLEEFAGDVYGSTANAINDQNQIVGTGSHPDATIGHAALWPDEKTIIDLGTLEGFGDSSAQDINETGVVTGYSSTTRGNRTFLWRDGELKEVLGSLGDGRQKSEPNRITDSRIIVGQGNVDAHNRARPFVYYKGRWLNLVKQVTDKGFSGGTAWDVNEAGQVVGYLGNDKTVRTYYGYIWEFGEGVTLLDDLIPPHSDWLITDGVAINKHGQIVAWADPVDHPEYLRSLLLTPIEPEMELQIPDGPLRADAINTFSITNAQPSATIKFFYGKKGGGKRIPGCDALAAMTQIDDPVAFGEAIADANGNAELDIYIPPRGAVHWGFLLQAVDFQNCEESQLVLKKVE